MNTGKGKSVRFDDRNKGGFSRSMLYRGTMIAGGALLLSVAPTAVHKAQAEVWQLGDFTITLQSTLRWTGGVRTGSFDNKVQGVPQGLNTDDGDRNFHSGVMADRFQTLEQLNIQNGDYGLRASGLAFIDTEYLQNSKNNSAASFNSYNVGNKGFPSATVASEGRRLEPLALFVYGAEEFADGNDRLSWQVGRQTITWGETLFSIEGISGLQAPQDAYQGQLLPDPQAQAVFLPTGAAQAAFRFGNGLTLDAYWQFEYEPDILPGVGSYFSPADVIGPGAQRILGSTTNDPALGPYAPASIYRGPDVRPTNGLDQFGVSGHQKFGLYEVGLYFVRGIPKSPTTYTNIYAPSQDHPTTTGFAAGQYNLVYGEPVNAMGISASTLVGAANVAGELSGRINTPLESTGSFYTGSGTPAWNNALYAKGDIINASLSTIWQTAPLPLMPNGAAILGELTANKVVAYTQNKAALAPGNTALGIVGNVKIMPTYFPLGDLQLDFPVSWAPGIVGDSQYAPEETAGTGTIDVGVQATYRSVWIGGINYQRYYGPPNRQTYLDRDFATIFVERTF